MQSTKTTEREFSAISFETSYKTIGVNLSPVWADLFVFIIIFFILNFLFCSARAPQHHRNNCSEEVKVGL